GNFFDDQNLSIEIDLVLLQILKNSHHGSVEGRAVEILVLPDEDGSLRIALTSNTRSRSNLTRVTDRPWVRVDCKAEHQCRLKIRVDLRLDLEIVRPTRIAVADGEETVHVNRLKVGDVGVGDRRERI